MAASKKQLFITLFKKECLMKIYKICFKSQIRNNLIEVSILHELSK